MKLTGVGVSPGIVLGKGYVFASERFSVSKIHIDSSTVEREVERFKSALAKTSSRRLH